MSKAKLIAGGATALGVLWGIGFHHTRRKVAELMEARYYSLGRHIAYKLSVPELLKIWYSTSRLHEVDCAYTRHVFPAYRSRWRVNGKKLYI